jgi:hypothetical protein
MQFIRSDKNLLVMSTEEALDLIASLAKAVSHAEKYNLSDAFSKAVVLTDTKKDSPSVMVFTVEKNHA